MTSAVSVNLPEWAAILWEPKRHIAVFSGRGAGKSRSIATALVLQAATSHRRVLCARETQRSIRDSVKRLLDDEIERCGLTSAFVSTDNEIRGPNDSLFVFAGLRSNIASVKSLEGITDAWVEEASTVSKSSIETLVPTIRGPGSRLFWSWNPGLPTDPVDAMFRGPNGPPPNTILRGLTPADNPWFPEELKVELEYDQTRDPEKYAHIWLGEYRRNSEARVFRNWRVEAFDTPADAQFYFGADWGYSVDPTTLVRMWIDGRTLYIDHEAYKVGCEIDATPALFDTVPGSRSWVIRADSARPETISFMQRSGFRIQPAAKGAGSVEDGVAFLQSYDIVAHPRCQHVIDELTLYTWKTDPLTGDVLPALADKDNHMIDSARYALEGVRRGLGRVDIAAATPRITMPTVARAPSGAGWGGVPMPRMELGH